MDEHIVRDARRLWDYHCLGEAVGNAEVILGLGSYDGAVAEHAASLLLDGKARWIVFSGGITRRRDLLKSQWTKTEAEEFREIAIRCGAPAHKIILEPAATNTGENFRLSHAKLAELGMAQASLIVITKPYMERRARATGRVHLDAGRFVMTSAPTSFEDYCFRRHDPALVFNLMVGDLQRIQLYPALGFQTAEEIPEEVTVAFHRLVAAGFDKHLIKPVG